MGEMSLRAYRAGKFHIFKGHIDIYIYLIYLDVNIHFNVYAYTYICLHIDIHISIHTDRDT